MAAAPTVRIAILGALAACRPPVPGTPPKDTSPEDEPADTVPTESVPGVEGLDHLPVLLVDTAGQGVPWGYKVDATLDVITRHDGTLGDLDGAPREWEGRIGIEIHGSSSTGYPKYNYRFEARDDAGEDLETPLLDLPGGTDWVLHGPYCDKTFVRNALAYALGRAVQEPTGHWEPRTAFTELFVDGAYQGVYLLVERVMRDGDRIAIGRPAASAAEGDVTGGYIVRIDQHRNAGFDTALGTPIDYDYPDADAITHEQDAWLRGWFDAFEAVLAGDAWTDPSTGYPARLDVDSWVDHFLLNEIAHNIDAYRLSAYLWKDADAVDGRLHAGPLWDFDRAWGNVDYCTCWDTAGWIIDSLDECGYAYQFPAWWTRLLSDPGFQDRLRCRWEELRAGVLADDAILALVEEMVAATAEAEERDHALWGTIGVYVSPNWYVGDTYRDEVDWLEDWIVTRTAWMDANVPGTCG